MDIGKLYNENRKIIEVLARKSQFDLADYDEFVSLGNLIFMLCVKHYKGRSKFSTYFYQALLIEFYKFKKNLIKKSNFETSIDDSFNHPYYDHVEDDLIFKITLENLSCDARTCVDIILDKENEIRSLNRTSIHDYLKDQGWKEKVIRSSFHEIREVVTYEAVN